MSFHHEKLTVYQRERTERDLSVKTCRFLQRCSQIAHGSALECAACLDLLVARRCCAADTIVKGKEVLEEVVRMLFTMLDKLGCRIAEDAPLYEDKEEAGEED